jgi:hypothetical protein
MAGRGGRRLLLIDGRQPSEERSRSWTAREGGRSRRLRSSCEARCVQSCDLLFRGIRVHVSVVEKPWRKVRRAGPRIWRSRDWIETGRERLVGRVGTGILLLLLLLLASARGQRMDENESTRPTAWAYTVAVVCRGP